MFVFPGSFFLCRINQNVVAGGKSRQFKLNWLSEDDNTPGVYKLDYMDKAEMDSILTNVRMDKVGRDTFQLPDEEKRRVDQVRSNVEVFCGIYFL
jgi:hypothetical protein